MQTEPVDVSAHGLARQGLAWHRALRVSIFMGRVMIVSSSTRSGMGSDSTHCCTGTWGTT